MEVSLIVENIKCGGCANSVRNKLLELDSVEVVEVDVEQGLVTCTLTEQADCDQSLEQIKAALLSMGYPESGSVDGLKAAGAKAKSYVSCAVGKMSSSED